MYTLCISLHHIIDRVEEGLETKVIHVMFYNEVYVVVHSVLCPKWLKYELLVDFLQTAKRVSPRVS